MPQNSKRLKVILRIAAAALAAVVLFYAILAVVFCFATGKIFDFYYDDTGLVFSSLFPEDENALVFQRFSFQPNHENSPCLMMLHGETPILLAALTDSEMQALDADVCIQSDHFGKRIVYPRSGVSKTLFAVPDGRTFSLPISQAELTALFGEPSRIIQSEAH